MSSSAKPIYATAYTEAPSPPSDKILSASHPFACLPAGWTTAVDPSDGRIYYYNCQSGHSTWRHPSAPPQDDPKRNNSEASSGGGKANTNTNNNTTRDGKQQPLTFTSTAAPAGLYNENPAHATRRPDNHQCNAVVALVLCPPIGVLAIYHSCSVDSCWNSGLYGEAVNHARQAPKYACLGTFVGVCFWVYYIFFREGKFDWPDFNFD